MVENILMKSLFPLPVTDPVLVSRRAHEARFINEVHEKLATRTALVSWRPEAGHDLDRLDAMLEA